MRLREVIADLEAKAVDVTFAQLCATFNAESDLEEAAWRLAATFFPGESFAQQRKLLDEWGAEVARRLAKAQTEVDRIETLVEFLAHEIRLQGNVDDYYNINNSLLPEVIETRRGIPISLSLVYLLVGKRAGLQIFGVALPGHYLIRFGEDFFDPFNGGRRVTLEDCRMQLEEQNLTLTTEHLQPVRPPHFLMRMLNNLRVIAQESDPPLASKLSGWLEALGAG
jgi:regulator of sirC expression with transglutaminase-like and TPR domain